MERALGLAPAAKEPLPAQAATTATDYAVGHAAQVIAFTADDSARVVYPFGTRQEDWAHDLPKLTSGVPR